MRCAIIGTGFWSQYQVAAWKEIPGVDLVSVYNRDRDKAAVIAEKFNIPNVYDDAGKMLDQEKPDFVDIITNVETHAKLTRLAAERGIAVICQKPMGTSLEEANEMVKVCEKNKVAFFVHENFRFQAPIRALKLAIDSNVIGTPFKATVSFCSGFPVFENQPALALLPRFILTDIGSHVLDICRFLFGEAKSLYALTKRVNVSIKGEDVANVLMEMQSGLHCFAEMSYASHPEFESFPQTLVHVEGDQGSIRLTNDFLIKTTTNGYTSSVTPQIPFYSWADPAYALVHSSIVECNRDILNGLRGGKAQVTGKDNLRTVQLVWDAYRSAETRKVIEY